MTKSKKLKKYHDKSCFFIWIGNRLLNVQLSRFKSKVNLEIYNWQGEGMLFVLRNGKRKGIVVLE